jgi:hypothetical protein
MKHYSIDLSLVVILGYWSGCFSSALVADPPQTRPQAGKEFTNSLAMPLSYLPPGKFFIGSPEDEPGREKQETPREVELTEGITSCCCRFIQPASDTKVSVTTSITGFMHLPSSESTSKSTPQRPSN